MSEKLEKETENKIFISHENEDYKKTIASYQKDKAENLAKISTLEKEIAKKDEEILQWQNTSNKERDQRIKAEKEVAKRMQVSVQQEYEDEEKKMRS
jgi:hypothetical protein